MKIINIKIDEFGCLSDKNYDLSEGFNLAMGENESGKSTLQAFIKFIFYGLPKKTLESAVERDRSFSWKSDTASGSLTLADDSGSLYTVYRRAVRKRTEKRETVSEECRIIDEKSGAQVHKDESPADIFLGIPAAVFESTSFVRQAGVTDVSPSDVGSSLENILMSADESIDLEKALERLDGARKLLLHKKGSGGLLSDLEAERDRLSARLEKAKTGYASILSMTDTSDRLRREALEKRRELDKLEVLSSAVAKAEAVKRFDSLHEKEAQLASVEAELDRFRKNAAGKSGFIPDTAFAASLREAISGLEGARLESSMADTVQREAEAMLSREIRETEKSCPLSPEEIRSRGGADMICDGLLEELAISNKKKKNGKALLAVFAAALTLGAALIGLSFLLSPLLYAGIGAAAASMIFAVLGSTALKQSKKLKNRTEGELSALGVSNTNFSAAEERIALLRNDLLICLEKEARIKKLEARCDSVRSVAALRQKDLESAEERATALAEKWKALPEGDPEATLPPLIGEAEEVIRHSDELFRSILTLKGQADTLRQSLEGMNEADLRARVSPTAMKIYESGNECEVENRRRYTAEALRTLQDKSHRSEKELIRLENETEDPARLAVMLEENRRSYEKERLRFDAVMMATEALSEASGDIRSSVSPVLRAKAEGYMAALTGNKYSNMGIGENYAISAKSDGDGVRSALLLSAGTKDCAYLSLRLALLEVIFKDEKPFLILDEALSQLDDNRAAAALRILASYCNAGGQCLLFTCHSREEKLLSGIVAANIIRL